MQLRQLLLESRQLRRVVVNDIRPVGTAGDLILVVLLGGIESHERHYQRDRPAEEVAPEGLWLREPPAPLDTVAAAHGASCALTQCVSASRARAYLDEKCLRGTMPMQRRANSAPTVGLILGTTRSDIGEDSSCYSSTRQSVSRCLPDSRRRRLATSPF